MKPIDSPLTVQNGYEPLKTNKNMAQSKTIVKGFSLPIDLYDQAIEKARSEDRTFSSYMRRVLSADLASADQSKPVEPAKVLGEDVLGAA
jgi:hypothetical protein